MSKQLKLKTQPNMTLLGGPWPNNKVYWPVERTISMRIRMGWEYGHYVRTSDTEATWRTEAPRLIPINCRSVLQPMGGV